MTYETQAMNFEQSQKFQKFFDKKIGTEREISPNPNGESDSWYFNCHELCPKNVQELRNFENKL